MYRYNGMTRVFVTLAVCLITFIGTSEISTNAVFKSDSVERLMQVAARETGIYTTFNPYLGEHGSIVVEVTGLGSVGGEFATFKGCIARFSNESDMVYKLSSLPSDIQGVEIQGGQFDLSAISPCEGVKYFSARCCGLSASAPTLCALFPYAETMILDISEWDDVDLCLECLMRMRNLRRLELSCHRFKGRMGKNVLQKFVKCKPQLERLELSVWCDLGRGNQWDVRDSKCHTFEISDYLADNNAGIIEVPDCEGYTDVTLRLYSPTIRFVEFRPAHAKGSAGFRGLKSMTLNLHNVIPSGEESIIDCGELKYSIHIDGSR